MLKTNRFLKYWQGLFEGFKETRKELKSNVEGWHLENRRERIFSIATKEMTG